MNCKERLEKVSYINMPKYMIQFLVNNQCDCESCEFTLYTDTVSGSLKVLYTHPQKYIESLAFCFCKSQRNGVSVGKGIVLS